jgi:hypothetical protein
MVRVELGKIHSPTGENMEVIKGKTYEMDVG